MISSYFFAIFLPVSFPFYWECEWCWLCIEINVGQSAGDWEDQDTGLCVSVPERDCYHVCEHV